MANIHVPDLQDIYFQTITNELNANSSSVPLVLGGDMYGHLGLVLTDTQYAMLSSTPFPGPFDPPVKALKPKSMQPMMSGKNPITRSMSANLSRRHPNLKWLWQWSHNT